VTHAELHELATGHGRDAAENYWVTDPAEPEHAREWIRTAEAGTLHDYILPSPFEDFMPCDLSTEGWSWGELSDYEGYWLGAYLERTTELMRQLLAKDGTE
jgi:hypothetical protein